MIRTSLRVVAFLALLSCFAACGDDDDGGGGGGAAVGGSCTTKDGTCFYVSNPSSYDLKGECTAFGHTWSANECGTTGFDRKCTQETNVSIDNGPAQKVTYVYFFPTGSSTTCLGTEEKL